MDEREAERAQERLQEIRNRRKRPYETQQTEILHRKTGETILPRDKKKKSRFNTRWISGLFLILFIAAVGVYTMDPYFRVNRIRVNGMKGIDPDELAYFTGTDNKPVYMIDPEAIEAAILKHYENARSAKVTVEMPNSVSVDIEERIAAVQWDFGGSSFMIDSDGKVLETGRTDENTIHILADSFPGGKAKDDREIPSSFSADTFRSMLTMGEMVPDGKTLYYTFDHGYGWDTDEGWRIFYGKSDADIGEKEAMAAGITAYLKEEEIQPVLLSLEFKDAPYYRYSE